MIWLKSCPKCHGDLFAEYDLGQRSLVCLQCGKVLTEIEERLIALCRDHTLASAAPAQSSPRAA